MDFELTDIQRMVQKTARDFAAAELAPHAAAFEKDEAIPPEVFRKLADLGLMGVNIPEALGGAEAGTVAYSLAMTEIARGCASTAVTMAVTNMVGEVIARFGSDAQKKKYNPLLSSGVHGAFALSEVGAGSDPAGMATTARPDGDGFVLAGTKQWISHGDTAGVIVVWARTGGPGTKGISCFLVEGGTPGLSVTKHEDKMGLRASHTVGLVFDDIRLPADAMLGREGQGFAIAMMALDGGRIGIASQALGIAEAALEEAVAYSKERRAFNQPIADFQAIQWKIANSRKDLDAARLLIMRAAWLKERGEPFTREASMAKVFTTEAAWRVCNDAVQVLGGYGYIREFAAERHLRDVRVTQIYEGTSEVQRIVISRALLR